MQYAQKQIYFENYTFRMDLPPPDCQPGAFKWVRTSDLLVQIILYAMPWYNWTELKSMVQHDIESNTFVQLALAKKGYWFRFTITEQRRKLAVELFIRVVPLD